MPFASNESRRRALDPFGLVVISSPSFINRGGTADIRGAKSLFSALQKRVRDLALGCFLQPASGLRLLPLYRFSLMVIESEADAARRARPLRWDDLVDARLIGSPPEMPIQQLIERQLACVGRRRAPELTLTFFETQIAMAEVGAGVAVVPTFAIPACRGHKVVMHRLVDPEVPVDFVSVVGRGRWPPPRAEGFTNFLKSYIAEFSARFSRRAQAAAPPPLWV